MTLTPAQRKQLKKTIESYGYPLVTYDFVNNSKIYHNSPREFEHVIRLQLQSDQLEVLKRGLANVLFWGHYTGPGKNRWKRFLCDKKVNESKLKECRKVFDCLSGKTGIAKLKGLCLPEFSN
jgi:hypothetical protein